MRIDIQRNKQAKSLVTTMIVIALASLILRFAIEKIMQINIAQNESNASSGLKLIVTALENYAQANQGVFPENLSLLTQASPPYLNKDYSLQTVIKGYIYSCSRLDSTGYSCSALPAKCGLSGRSAYTITTGGALIGEDCRKQE